MIPLTILQAKLEHFSTVAVGAHTAKCPAHVNAELNSLSLHEHGDGGADLYCAAGCTRGQVLACLGLQDDDSTPRFVFSAGYILSQPYKTVENIAFHATRGEICLLQSVTDKGKSTFVRNALISLACGKPFPPVVETAKARRVLLLDFESSERRFDSDLHYMKNSLSKEELELLKRNFFIVRHAWVFDEPLSLTSHFNLVYEQVSDLGVDVVVVDTASAAFALRNENDNAEVTREALKPLLQMARKLGVAVVIVHHIGKLTTEAGQSIESAYKGRGASAFGCYAASVLNLHEDAHKPDSVMLKCAKRKDGGERYEAILKLDRESRWFAITESATISHTPTNHEIVMDAIRSFGMPVKRSEVVTLLHGKVSRATADRCLLQGIQSGELLKDRYGFYSLVELSHDLLETDSENAVSD